jgi:hypothetical protein
MTLVPVPVQTVNNAPMYLKFAIGVIGASLWAYFAIAHVQDTTGFLEFDKLILAGLAGHLLGTSNQPKQVLPFQSN